MEECEKDSAGNEKAKVLILSCGKKYIEWERDSAGNQKAKFEILPCEKEFKIGPNLDKPLEDLSGLIPDFITKREELSQPEIKKTAMWIIRSWCLRWF